MFKEVEENIEKMAEKMENFGRDLKSIKHNQIAIVELKYKISEVSTQ